MGCSSDTVKWGSQLALEDARNRDGTRYLGGGVRYLTRGGRGGPRLKTGSAKFHGTVDEDPTCSSWSRIKHIDVRHNLVRDACDAGKLKVVCGQDAD